MAGIGEITKWVQKMGLKTAGTSLDTDGNLQLLQQLYQSFKSLTCREPTCRARLSVGGATEHIKAWVPYAKGRQPTPISAVLCERCKRYTCIGCGGKPALGSKSVTVHKSPEITVNNCCDYGKLFGVWVLLSAFDEAEISVQKQATQNALKSSGRPSAGKGTGYSSGWADFGARRMSMYPYSSADSSFQQQDGNDGREDPLMTDILKILPLFLPSANSKPAPELFAMFRLSLLIDRLAELIRNDSVTDMTRRKDLYHTVFAFLTAVAKHPALVDILLEQRPAKRGSPGLQALGEEANRKGLKVDTSSAGLALSLVACGQKTSQHAKAFASLGAMNDAIKQDAQSRESKETVDLCTELLEFYLAVRATAPAAYEALTPVAKDAWKIYAEKNRVTFTDDVLEGHMFLEGRFLERDFSRFTERPLGRMKRLHEELATLTTSLNDDIFLKISDARLDVMKVMIRGVRDSPYEGGLFVFDLYLPQNWPMEPPKVFFAMDKGEAGRNMFSANHVPLNPNIHPDGKVCLSLLNTFPGPPEEMWQPNRTLLSVFISIQAMILGEPEPYRSEPGRELKSNSREAKAYNKQVQCKTVLYAMLFWLESVQAKRSVWKDITATYWIHNGKKVLDNVKQWSKSNEALRVYDKDNNNYHESSGRRGRTGRGADLVARLEKGLSSSGTGMGEQAPSMYRY